MALVVAQRGMQFQRIAGHPRGCRAHAGPGARAVAGKAVPVHRAVAPVHAGGQCGFVGPGSVAGTGGVDPDQAPGGVGAEVFGHQQRAAHQGGGAERAAGFLLHHIVGPEGVAHVPAHHFFAGAPAPAVEQTGGCAARTAARGTRTPQAAGQHGLVHPGIALPWPAFGVLVLQGNAGVDGHTTQPGRAAQLGLHRGRRRLHRSHARHQCIGLRQRPTASHLPPRPGAAQLAGGFQGLCMQATHRKNPPRHNCEHEGFP